MRILFLSTWFPYPPDNGAKIRAYHLLRACTEEHRVTLLAFQPENQQIPLEEVENLDVYPVPDSPFRYVNLPKLVQFASPVPLLCWPNRRMKQAVAAISAQQKWDAVVAVQSPVAQYTLQWQNTPKVLDIDTSLSYQMHERYVQQQTLAVRLRTWVSWQKTQQYESHVFRRFDVATVVSPLELDFVRGMLRCPTHRVQVVPNGVDCNHHRPGLAPVIPDTLVYNGALTYSANYDAMQYFLAEIYPRIRQENPRTTLTITGSTKRVDLGGLLLDSQVRLSGYVEDIRPFVAGAAVCIVPIRQGGGTRIKILEAMALGTPVVSTRKGAEGLDVTDGENILLADKPAVFAESVLRLLRDANLRAQLAANARRHVESHYDWSQIREQFVGLLENAVIARSQRLEGEKEPSFPVIRSVDRQKRKEA